MDTNNESITIDKQEYNRLIKDSLFLEALEGAGVDNWEGYSDARRSLKENERGS